MGERTSGGVGRTLCQCASPPVAGVRDQKLSELHGWFRAGAVQDGNDTSQGAPMDGKTGTLVEHTGLEAHR